LAAAAAEEEEDAAAPIGVEARVVVDAGLVVPRRDATGSDADEEEATGAEEEEEEQRPALPPTLSPCIFLVVPANGFNASVLLRVSGRCCDWEAGLHAK
jgi:hypothetical protein